MVDPANAAHLLAPAGAAAAVDERGGEPCRSIRRRCRDIEHPAVTRGRALDEMAGGTHRVSEE